MKYKELIQRLKDTVYRGENIQEACDLIIYAAAV
jgi:hypothetical protein